MEVKDLAPEVVVAIINAASNIATAKIQAIGEEYARDFDFFNLEFGRVAKVLLKEVNKE